MTEGTVAAWHEAIMHGRELTERDALRVRDGFDKLLAVARRWPSPAQFLEIMPKRDAAQVLTLPVGRDEQERRDAIAKAALERIGRIVGDVS